MSTEWTSWNDFCKKNGITSKRNMGRRSKARMEQDDSALMKGEGGTFIEEMKRLLSVTKVKRAFNLGSELFGAAGPFLEKPTWWNAGKAVFAMGKVLVEDVEVWADDYFGSDDWTEPYGADFNQTLLNVLQRFPYERIKTAEESTFVRVCTLPGDIRVGWTYHGRLQQVDHIYVETDRLEEAKACIKRLLWEQFKGKSLVMRKNTRMTLASDEPRVVFEIDDAFGTKSSKRATEYAEYLRRPFAENVSRSVMFYGPPGTGKSTLARTIVELMGLRSFRIRIGDLGGLDNSTLFEAVNIFEPDAVILDDFDRAHGQAQLLETLEFFKQRVKLVITTVNNRKSLDEALMRPGRIDELVLIDKMDEEIVKHVLGPYIDGYDMVKDWPIAFIEEYVTRRKYMSSEEAAKSVEELAYRVEEMANYRDEKKEDVVQMIRILKRAAKRRVSEADAVEGSQAEQESDDDDDSDDDDFPT